MRLVVSHPTAVENGGALRPGLISVWLFGVGLAAFPWPNAAGQAPATISAYDTPMACIEALHDGLISVSSEQGPGGLAQRFQRLEPLIVATHDLPYIAEFTVRRHWERFDVEGREAFIQTFQRLSVMTYASRFVALSEDTFSIQESRELVSGRAQVIARIMRAEPPDIPLEYILHQDEAGWRIINVVADGVSDLALKRAEYQRVLGEGSVADLLDLLEQQIAAL